MKCNTAAIAAILFAQAVLTVFAACPYMNGNVVDSVDLPPGHPPVRAQERVDYNAVARDIEALLTDSQPWWPADYGNYGPFFIRLAWHCSGSYRTSDGRGGCDGGNIRFNPVHSWTDNTNLDKAILLLEPIKLKYGPALSWGDLAVLAGTTAIESMGGPVLGFCGGRIDDHDGFNSLELGPTKLQQEVAPCIEQGNCKEPLGSDTVGLIYVNPEGYMANHIPEQSVPEIRDVFARMGMNDTETVALIGGGHTFGKTHGACLLGPGDSPHVDPYNSWAQPCSNGTYTSGMEGPWTQSPTAWNQDYWNNLLNYKYELVPTPGGAKQFEPVAGQGAPRIMMMTTDIALTTDSAYMDIATSFKQSPSYFGDAFSKAWYKLVSRDMGPATRCAGENVPPPQDWQHPLPVSNPNASTVHTAQLLIQQSLYSGGSFSDPVGGKNYQGALYVQLAWQSASTFRKTDYRGGADGAAIRFAPQKNWKENTNMDLMINQLATIQAQAGDISMADLIVLAGNVALNEAGEVNLDFCPGRGDAADGSKSQDLEPRNYIVDPIQNARDNIKVMGLSDYEYVALAARPRSAAYMKGLGYTGSWSTNPSILDNTYFDVLLNLDYLPVGSSQQPHLGRGLVKPPTILEEYKATDANVYMTGFDMAIRYNPILRAIAQNYLSNNDMFMHHFKEGWTKLMNADRFDGPYGNLCHDPNNIITL